MRTGSGGCAERSAHAVGPARRRSGHGWRGSPHVNPARLVVFTRSVLGGWSRRALLIAAAGAAGSALAGCSWRADPPPPVPPDPLLPLLRSTDALAAHYQAVRAAYPDLADRLAGIHEAHLAHVAALRELTGADPSASPSAAVSPSPPTPTDDPAAVLTDLAAREQTARAEAAAACLSAAPARAALLGSITAARATHLVVLES